MKKWLYIKYLKLKSLINKDAIILSVDVANKSSMSFKNGSIIEIIPVKSDTIRGKKGKLSIHYDDFDYNRKEELDEILKSYQK